MWCVDQTVPINLEVVGVSPARSTFTKDITPFRDNMFTVNKLKLKMHRHTNTTRFNPYIAHMRMVKSPRCIIIDELYGKELKGY